MLKLEIEKGIDKSGEVDVEILEEFIRVENEEDLKVIHKIQTAIDEQITNTLKGETPDKNMYGLTNRQIADIVSEVYQVLNEEGCGLLTLNEEIQK